MKKSIEIIGLPIINISAGLEIGYVKSLVVNPEKGTVDFLTIEHEDWQVSVKAIPFSKVIGIGEFAVTIESDHSIIDLNEIPIANQLVNKRIKITETRVMTRKGQLLGEANEYYIDEDTGVIIGLQLSMKDKTVIVKAELVLTFGKDILVVKDEVTAAFLDSEDELIENLEQNHVAEVNTKQQNDNQVEDFNTKQIDEINAKQLELLEGKTVVKDIYSSDNRLLIPKNTVLTQEDIIKAQNEGPSAFVELSMNTEL
jgi:uncharacterized protein YrrD